MSVKERLTEYLEFKKISKTDFGKAIGVSASYINSIRKSVQPDKILSISQKYPDLNTTWLLTGEGDMIKGGEVATNNSVDETISTGRVIPYYDVEAAAGLNYEMNMNPSRPVGMIEIGGLLKDSESALRIYGNSMTPNYPAGCVIGLRKHYDSFIEPGCVYVVETRDNRYLKRLYYNKSKTAFRCVSDNNMKYESGPMTGEYFYPDFEIPFDHVMNLHRVIGVIKRNVI